LTIGAGLTIQGYQSLYNYSTGSLVGGINNFGTIDSTVPGQTLYINGNLTNRGLVRVAGGDMYVYNGSAFTNASGAPAGTLLVNSGTLTLNNGIVNGGTFTITGGTTNLGG